MPEGGEITDALSQFQVKWELDERCMDMLRSLPPEAQNSVMKDFDHQPGQTNPSARCMAFAKKMAVGTGVPADAVDALVQFQAVWGLDERCMDMLRSLPPEAQTSVMKDFDHQPGQTNPSARCMAFAKKFCGGAGPPPLGAAGAAPKPIAIDPLSQFQAHWGLDERCMDMLRSLPLAVQTSVIEHFRHEPGQTNPSARCMAFAKSFVSGGGTPKPSGLDPLSQFQAQWGLDDRCMEVLVSLPLVVQTAVIQQFRHHPGQTNPSARCMAFAKRMATGGGVPEPVDPLSQFQAQWGLDDRCMEVLASLPFEVQTTVIQQFSHHPGLTNPSARCTAFAKKCAGAFGSPPPPADASSRFQNPWWSPVVALPRSTAQWAASSVGALAGFQAQWGLDSRCMQVLQSLPPAVQATVIAEFQHGPEQTNPSARCQAFAKKLMESQQAPLAQFQAQWGFDERCMDFLAALPPDVLPLVISGFKHEPGQTNPSARCQAFAKSILQQRATGDGGGCAGEPAGAPKRAWHPVAEATDVPADNVKTNDVQEFQAKWGLDDRSMQLLTSMPLELQQTAIEQFDHQPGQTNPSARFMAFAKSLWSRANDGEPPTAKRRVW